MLAYLEPVKQRVSQALRDFLGTRRAMLAAVSPLGADAGDRILAASGSERLRFKVTLPLSTGNAYQGTTCTVAFVFDAEQTANNP